MEDRLVVDSSYPLPDELSDHEMRVLNHLPDFYFILSAPEFRYVALNRATLGLHRMYGLGIDDVLGKQPWELQPGVRKRLLPLYQEVCRTGEIRQVKNHQLVGPGSLTYWDFTFVPHKDSSGNVTAISTVGTVVTKRYLAEEALSRLDTETTHILESITDGFVSLDRDYRYTYANRNAENLLQHPREHLIGKRLWEISPAALGTGLHNACEKALSDQEPTSLEHYSARFDAWFENHIYPYHEGVSIFFRDITERKRREKLGDALNTISGVLNSSLDADEILDHALREASRALRAETAALNLLDGDIVTVHSVYGLAPEWIGVQYSAKNGGVSEAIVQTGETVIVTDAITDQRVDAYAVEVCGVRAVLAVPLTILGQIVGMMKFRYLSPRKEFSTSELDFASKLAASVSLALRNARLVADLQTEIAERTERENLSDALNRVNSAVNSTLDFEEIMDRALLESAQALRADSAVINLRQDDRWVMHYTYGESPESLVTAYAGDHSRLSDLAAETGELLAISNTAEDERINRRVTEELGIRSVLVVPLKLYEEVVGVMKFRYASPRPEFSQPQLDFAEKLSASVSLALHNSRLVSDLQTEIAERTYRQRLSDALNRINADVTSTLEAEAIMYKAIRQASETLGADMAAVNLREDDHWVIGCTHGLPEDIRGNRFSGERARLSELVAGTGQLQAIADAETDPRIDNTAAERYGIKSVLALPLTLRGGIIGIIAFRYKTRKEQFSEAEIDFANKLGVSVSLALENTRLVESLMSEVEERSSRERLSSALNAIHEAINSTLDFDEIMSRALHESAKALHAHSAAINLRDGDEWIASYTFGSPNALAGKRFSGYRAPVSNLVAKIGGLAVVCDTLTDDRVEREELLRHGIRAVLAAPLTIRGELVGVIVFRFLEPRDAFSESEVDFLSKLASAVTLALENSRLVEDLQVEIGEREKAEERLQTHLHLLQQALLPPKPSIGDGYQLASAYVPAFDGQEIGGDFYDVYRTEDDKIVLLIGDVSGKGIEAAALASAARNTVRAFVHQSPSPGEVLNRTNAVLASQHSEDQRFATVFLAVIDPLSGEMRYACAGHPPALLHRRGGVMDFLSCGNMPVGVSGQERFREMSASMMPGDKLILYTDGITDVRADGRTLGVHGVERVVRRHEDKESHGLVKEILNAATNWAPERTSDDMAVIVVERLP